MIGYDSAGNESAPVTYHFTIDLTAPTNTPVIVGLSNDTDSGIKGDLFTNNPKFTLVGTAHAHQTVVIGLFLDQSSEIGRTVADQNGDWSFTLPEIGRAHV